MPAGASELTNARFEAELAASLNGAPATVRGLLLPHLTAGGKRLRPLLVLYSGAFGRNPGPGLVRAAVAVELLHTASLFHDDVIDDAKERRGLPSVYKTHGAPLAAAAGSHLALLAFDVVCRLDGVAPPVLREIRRCFAVATADTCEGEFREALNTDNADVSEAEVLEIVERKTARLFELSCRLGALVTGGPVEPLARYGRLFGILFQIADDIKDIVCRPGDLGKPTGSDLRSGCYTLPVIFALEANDPAGKSLRARAGLEPAPPEVERLLGLLRQSGAVDRTVARARELAGEARGALAGLPRGRARAALETLVGRVIADLDRYRGSDERARTAHV